VSGKRRRTCGTSSISRSRRNAVDRTFCDAIMLGPHRHLYGLLGFVLIVSACAGYRMGYFSRPYVGQEAPSDAAAGNNYQHGKMKEVSLRDVLLVVNLHNEMHTSDTAWAGPVPLHLDLETRRRIGTNREGLYCLEVRIIPKVDARTIVFDPAPATLTVDDVSYPMKALQMLNSGQQSPPVAAGPILFAELEKRYAYRFGLCFSCDRPQPEQDIQLNLDKAIQVAGRPQPLLIKFIRTRYRHPYS